MSKRRRYTNAPPPQQAPRQEAAQPASAPPPAPKPVQERERIGDILRRVREHRGEDIESISDYLRIRPSFLIALESSHYNEIPADAYVIGFLRSYALYLGLDGKAVVEQYRREMAGRRRAPQLTMPQPLSEGRIPTPAILIAAGLACLVIYGLWYGLSTPDRSVLDEPVPLPTELSEEPALDPASEALAASPAGDLLLQTTTGAEEALSSLAAGTPPAAPALPAAKPEPEPTATAGKSKGRVIITAEQKSWILVTDKKGITVFDKNLAAGESYGVPEQEGLRLTTGNAGGLSLTLDGALLPKIGGAGQIARNIVLDPEKLKAGFSEETPASSVLLPAD